MRALPVLLLLAVLATGAQGAELRRPPPIAFASNREDHQLVIVQLEGTRPHVLSTGRPDANVASWSPDGTRVAFSHYDGRRERVDVLDLRTGRVRNLGEGYNPDWSPDGKRLVFLDASGFDDLVTMRADGAERRRLGLNQAGISDETDPAWSPDGRRIAFVGDGLYVVRSDGRNPRRIRPEGNAGGASWSPDGRHIAFDCVIRRFFACTVRPDGTGLKGLSRAGEHPSWSPRANLIALTSAELQRTSLVRANGKVVRTLRGLINVDWAPNGRRLVGEHVLPDGVRLYSIDPTGRTLVRLTKGSRQADAAPAWSPNGNSIAFRRRAHGRCSLAVLDIGTLRARTLVGRTRARFCDDRPDWSRDGRRIVYSSGADLWTVSPQGGRPRRLTSTKTEERGPRWAPDGRSIGFVATGGIWIMRPGGARRLLVSNGGYFSWSRSGAELAYALWNETTQQSDLYLKKAGAPPQLLFEGIDGAPAWSPDGSRIALSHTDSDPHGITTLLVVDLSGNATDIAEDPAGDPDWRP